MQSPPSYHEEKKSTMYRLMQSLKVTLEHPTLGPMSSFRQRLMGQYPKYRGELAACETANARGPNRYYVLNELGQENFRGSWID
jgi:hypothetical protein